MSRDQGSLDAHLHLLDRQVVDEEGRMVCKVDDLEISERPDGGWAVTALLTGESVWLPRVSHWLHQHWLWLSSAETDREYPYRIGFDMVEEISSEVRLNRKRAGLLERDFDTDRDGRHQFGQLLAAEVRGRDGRTLGKVLDVRLETEGEVPVRKPEDHMLVTWLLVGKVGPGTLLGYDRREAQGPWILNKIVTALHRHSGMVRASDVEEIDWEKRVVTVAGGLEPLTPANAPGRPLRDR